MIQVPEDMDIRQNEKPCLYLGRILLGEINPLIASMKKASARWSSHQQDEKDPFIKELRNLQMMIIHMQPDSTLEPSVFLDPFLNIIRSEDFVGPITKNSLAAVNRILNYGLLNPSHPNSSSVVESVASAVTHAKFVGTDSGADEVVLSEILTVLRSLILSPVGHLLTNESVCEMLNSCFRISFETRLSELLRNYTKDAMRQMIQLIFSRLPQFKNDPHSKGQRLEMKAGLDQEMKTMKAKVSPMKLSSLSPAQANFQEKNIKEGITSDDIANAHGDLRETNFSSCLGGLEVCDGRFLQQQKGTLDVSQTHLPEEFIESILCVPSSKENIEDSAASYTKSLDSVTQSDSCKNANSSSGGQKPYDEVFTNSQGVKFTPTTASGESGIFSPYGLPCVKEVFRFLISLISPVGGQNTSDMTYTSLNLLTVALEISSDYISHNTYFLVLVQDQLCHNLLLHLKPESKPQIFMAVLRTCTLLFESLRVHLKFQLEMFLNKLINIIASDSSNVSYFYKEHSLEAVLQLWRMPGLISEIFINFDCNVYSANIFEELTNILSKNAFPVQGFYSTNILSLEALLTVVEIIDNHGLDAGSGVSANSSPVIAPCLSWPSSENLFGIGLLGGYIPIYPRVKAMDVLKDHSKINRNDLLQVKEKKNVIATGTDMFNSKPEKGISYLQSKGILDFTNINIAQFLRENPHLNKKVMGDFLSKKKNVDILSAFVKSFDFKGRRLDACLRSFLESFRLPGEAPLISIIIEHFASHWHLSNGNPFGKDDAAFTLAYAVIMLNVDQHNQNAKKQNIPMTLEQFCKNLRGVNDGADFDRKMLEEIYNAVHKEEIVMPAEQTGTVRENYLWKMMLKRGGTKEGKYLLINDNIEFDRELFSLCWGPTVASLSYVFDKSAEDALVKSALSGFKKCAQISARFSMSDVYDNLIISLCKFTTLTVNLRDPNVRSPEGIAVSFGRNKKAQLAAKSLFELTAAHADILREGWKNVIELILQLFRLDLLPDALVESEDFMNPSGKIRLVKSSESFPRVESGIFSSLYSYISLGESSNNKTTNFEHLEAITCAKSCIALCFPEKIIKESAFLRYESLNELLKAMIGAGDASLMTALPDYSSSKEKSQNSSAIYVEDGLDEYSQSFLLELVISVLVANKDRAGGVWPSVRDHIYSLLMSAAAVERNFLLERCVVAILKAAKVLLRRPELANPILQSLRMLLLLESQVLDRVALQIVSGIHEVLAVNADHVQDSNDWAILLALLECAGAGAKPPIVNLDGYLELKASNEDSTELSATAKLDHSSPNFIENERIVPKLSPDSSGESDVSKTATSSYDPSHNSGGWILVGNEGEIESMAVRSLSVNEWDIVHQRHFAEHELEPLSRSVDTLSFLVRERHITAVNLPCIVQTCRTFVEASLHGGLNEQKSVDRDIIGPSSKRKATHQTELDRVSKSSLGRSSPVETESLEISQSYQQLSEKLLDLMDTLHTSASHILDLKSHEEDSQCFHLNHSLSLWQQALCPLLQGIARYCCDVRPTIRSLSMTYLQRALLNHDLQTLNANEWQNCFNKVLFPLLARLLQPLDHNGIIVSLEETRVRAATLVQKVFLRHLTPLLTLPTFTALWLTVLDFMDKYLNTHRSDHLSDAIPEILKNMLLVMETTQIFHTTEGFTHLWSITWDRIDSFLPHFRTELFKSHPPSDIHHCVTNMEERTEKVEIIPEETDTLPLMDDLANTVSESPVNQSSSTSKPFKGLSLTQEVTSEKIGRNIVLQPPLPHIFPSSSSPPAASPFHSDQEHECASNRTCQNASSQFRSTSALNVLHFMPISTPLEPSPSSFQYSSRSTGTIANVPSYSSDQPCSYSDEFDTIETERETLNKVRPNILLLSTETLCQSPSINSHVTIPGDAISENASTNTV